MAWFNLRIKRDLRRAALFLWIMSFSAALSRARMALATLFFASSNWPASICALALLIYVRASVRILRLRKRLFSEERTRLRADFVFAKNNLHLFRNIDNCQVHAINVYPLTAINP